MIKYKEVRSYDSGFCAETGRQFEPGDHAYRIRFEPGVINTQRGFYPLTQAETRLFESRESVRDYVTRGVTSPYSKQRRAA